MARLIARTYPAILSRERDTMRRWLEKQGYTMVYRLALRKGPAWQWLHDAWAEFWYRRYCPHPVLKDDWRACACVAAGECGCENFDHYPNIYAVPNGTRETIENKGSS